MISINHLYQIWPMRHHPGGNEIPSLTPVVTRFMDRWGRASGETYSKSRIDGTRKQGMKTSRYRNQYVCN